MDPADDEKRAAAEAAALLVEDGMTVGLGTGTTVAYFFPALARRNLSITCVATSPATEDAARSLGLTADRFVAMVSSNKLVERLVPPVPLEVLPFGLAATVRSLTELGPIERRDGIT